MIHMAAIFHFRGRRGDLAKILWHDGVGLSLYAKRLDRGVHLAIGVGWRDRDITRADGLYAGRDRLAKSATDMAAGERRLSENIGPRYFEGATNRAVHDSLVAMDGAPDGLPDDIDALKAALIIERAKALEVPRNWPSRVPRPHRTWR